LVLLSPHAFGSFHQDGDVLLVNLTRQQIENSPSIDSDKPVSRQYEEDYYRYYGWQPYWEEADLWGASAFPMAPPPQLAPSAPANLGNSPYSEDDPHLRSTQAISGYHIQTSDGTIGHVTDFIIDDQNWTVCHIVVETGHWFSGKEIAISPEQIDHISYAESKVLVKLTKEAILEKPEFHEPPIGAKI
jgi:hypothetical protein